MSQHQDTSASKNTKSTPKFSVPPMGVPDDEILDVAPLFYKEGTHYIDRVIRDIVTRILNKGHSVKGVSTPLAQMYPPPNVEQPSGKGDDSSSSEKASATEGLRSLGQTVSDKGKSDGSSDDQEESWIHHIKPSVAKRMKTRKGKSVAELMSAREAKKTAVIGPSKPWSKVEIKKRKVKDDSEFEEDVEEDVPDISPAKKTTVRKSPVKRRVVVERELGKDAADVKEVIDLIQAAGILKTVVGFSQCYKGLVKEFIVNIPKDISNKNNTQFCKVYVRGRNNEGAGELEVTDNQVCREIIAKQVKVWPFKKYLPAGKLTIKYAILHKIGAANWVPANHISTIANTLGRFIFAVGTKVKFDYGRYMFDQIIKHATTNAVKLPIAFPSMICGIILNQHPGSHAEDIVMTSAMRRPVSKVGAIAELKETCKELGEGIRVATTRKQSLEALIESLEKTEGENVEHANVSHEEEAEAHTSSERSANNDDASGNSAFGATEEAANSSSTE
ncbi:uncharacterized protein LOC127080237 [Lathyrus oleraceus]|uniref:uncharacterized protein LOC127080237 n=1 Tax=Pisum sativum TaxID=3888 RepID=UPI0021CEA8A6|nr:uncharacterized protein LOC127080237 [Pisum sativum]